MKLRVMNTRQSEKDIFASPDVCCCMYTPRKLYIYTYHVRCILHVCIGYVCMYGERKRHKRERKKYRLVKWISKKQ